MTIRANLRASPHCPIKNQHSACDNHPPPLGTHTRAHKSITETPKQQPGRHQRTSVGQPDGCHVGGIVGVGVGVGVGPTVGVADGFNDGVAVGRGVGETCRKLVAETFSEYSGAVTTKGRNEETVWRVRMTGRGTRTKGVRVILAIRVQINRSNNTHHAHTTQTQTSTDTQHARTPIFRARTRKPDPNAR